MISQEQNTFIEKLKAGIRAKGPPLKVTMAPSKVQEPPTQGNHGPLPRPPTKAFFVLLFFALRVEKGKAKTKRDVESFQLRKSNNRVIKVLKMHPLSGGTNTS